MALFTLSSWGTARSTAHGAMLNIRGRRFDLSIHDAAVAIALIEGISAIVHYSLVFIAGPDLQLQWSTNQKKVQKSILHVGLGDPNSHRMPPNSTWAPGTTPTILNFDEAMELAKALRVAVKLTQPVAAVIP